MDLYKEFVCVWFDSTEQWIAVDAQGNILATAGSVGAVAIAACQAMGLPAEGQWDTEDIGYAGVAYRYSEPTDDGARRA